MENQQEMKEEVYEEEDVDFNALPEGCISSIISLTSPRDACTYCLVSSVFKSAAESDSVWEKFLPCDYSEILARVVSSPSPSPSSSSSSLSVLDFTSSKKQLYFSLCYNPILIDGGLKSFHLEKSTGKKCFMLGAKDLSIIWGSTPKYWKWTQFPGSRFMEVAELISVCWLEIHGKLETRLLSPKTSYGVFLVFKFVEGAYGFDHPPAEASVKIVDGAGNVVCSEETDIYLDPDGNRRRQLVTAPRRVGIIRNRFNHVSGSPTLVSRLKCMGQFRQEREDGWLEVEMGHFFNVGGENDSGEVQITLTETRGGNWKTGLVVEGIEIRPAKNK